MGKDKGRDKDKDRVKDKGILSKIKIFGRKHGDIPSNRSKSERGASSDNTPPNSHALAETECPGTFSGSPPPVPLLDGVKVLHDHPKATVVHGVTGNEGSTGIAHDQSKAEQHPYPQPCQTPPAYPKASSTSETSKEQPSQSPQKQGKQVPPQLVIGALWKEAADGLSPEDRKKLDSLIISERKGQAVDASHKGHGGSSPDGHGEYPSADHVSLIISRAKTLKEEDKKATWMPVVDKIIYGVLKFKSLGDAAVKFDKSGYASLGRSVVAFGLQVAENAKEVREFVFSSSEVVTGFMTRYAQYEKLYRGPQGDKEFDGPMTDVYKAILLYIVALDDFLQQCGPERLARAFYELHDRSISKKKEAMVEADTEVQKWLPIMQTKILNNLSQLLTQNLPEPSQPSRSCLQSLAFPEMDNRCNDIDPAAGGTCEWLLGHETYTSWAACDRTLLWIKGKPGSGKSTLLRYALKNAMKAPNIRNSVLVLSFFFHGRGTKLQRTPLGLFRSLLHQVLRAVPDALLDLVTICEERRKSVGEPGEKWQWHPHELQGFFRSSLPKVLGSRSILLFVDALDESGQANAIKLVKEFKSLLRLPPTSSQFRVCFTCRQYPVLDIDCPFEICLEHENKQDISTYVLDQLSEFQKRAASTIPNLIIDRAKGVFMWTRLVVERVLKLELEGEEASEIKKKVEFIPRKLDKLSLGLVRSMDEKPVSLKLIQWICFATRPLSIEELRWAMIVDTDCSHRSLQQCQDAADYIRDMTERKLINLSRGLVEAVPSSNTRVLQFIHQSVKDFFVKKGLSALDGSFEMAEDQSDTDETDSETSEAEARTTETESEATRVGIAHYRLSRTCIRYLAMDEIAQSLICDRAGLLSEFPLLHYATTSWVAHVIQSNTRKVSQDDLLDHFSWPSEALMQLWVRVYHIIESHGCPPYRSSMIHIVSRYQLVGPLRLILRGIDREGIDLKDNYGLTPLSWAARGYEEAVVQMLLTKGADIEMKCRCQTPLSTAAQYGREAVVQLLLENGAYVDATNEYNETPLLYAAKNGHAAIVQLLLRKGADIEAKSSSFQTPMEYTGIAYKAIMQSLKEPDDRTPLLCAAENGHTAVMQLLLKNGANIEARGYLGRTPLSWASKNGHAAAVQQLLKNGANIEATSDYGRTPLSWAAENRHEAIVQLLQNHAKNTVVSGQINPD